MGMPHGVLSSEYAKQTRWHTHLDEFLANQQISRCDAIVHM